MLDSYSREHIDGLRERVALLLTGKVPPAAPTLPRMTKDERADVATDGHRGFHGVRGLAPIIGFEATRRSAPPRDAISVGPDREWPGLPALELARPTVLLETVRCIAQIETQAIELNWELVS
jgi:hypothetical protein